MKEENNKDKIQISRSNQRKRQPMFRQPTPGKAIPAYFLSLEHTQKS